VRTAFKFVALVLLTVLAYPAWVGLQVWQQSHQDELGMADAIVVLGAAQYDGRPSPIFQARLDHAAYLYSENLSSTVIVTGGKRTGDRFTEAEAGRRYLIDSKGVAAEALMRESEGRTTLESLRNVWSIAEEQGLESVLLVSDPLHSERIKKIAGDLGFEPAYASPASYTQLNRSRATKARELVREVGSIILYQVLDR
jgi:uncharacterized SAM-binding protein YcdF (DUF218 family)